MRRTWVAIVGAGLGVAACGGTTTPDVERFASLDVVISDNPESKLALSTAARAYFAHHKSFGPNYFHGRLMGDIEVAISKNGRDWISLGTPTPVDFQLQIEGAGMPLHPVKDVPPGTYAHLRLTTSDGETLVEPGAEIGGETLDAPVTLELGVDGQSVVETRLSAPIVLGAGTRVTLAIDLNTEGWLSEENVEARHIPATDIESAISATPHQVLPAAVVMPRAGSV